MATTMLQKMEELLMEGLGAFIPVTSTSNGTTTTIVATGILTYDTGVLANKWAISTSGSNDREVRRISSVSSSTITVGTAFSNSTATNDTFEIFEWDPTHLQNAVNRAGEMLFPTLYVPLRDETLVIDNQLTNTDFETFSGGFTGWTEVGSPTVTAETTIVQKGTNSAKIVASGADGQLTQAPTVNAPAIAGTSVTFKAWCWVATASKMRIRIDWDGSTIINSDYHTGDSSWRLLSVSGAVPDDATQVKAIIEVEDGNTAYADHSWLIVKPVYKYTIPSTFILGPHKVRQQVNESLVEGPYEPFGETNRVKAGRILRLEGMGVLSAPSTSSGTVEIGAPQINLLIAQAKVVLHRILAGVERQQADYHFAAAREFQLEVDDLIRRPGVRMRPMGAISSHREYHFEEDSSGRYLLFDKTRESLVT